ncbi:DUF2345 domain-containing protein, partial [Caballeronia sp. EK]|uniref:DUF2345 domain-containing protein n=1 Tax=Caballeronia sp. EK TaxID=2767469 RepID=UPI001656699F
LRSDEHVAVRAAKGVFISADAQFAANGKQLDMQPAQGLLEQAYQQMQSLSEAAKAAQAIAADYEKQKQFLDETLTQLKKAGVLVSAPDGVGLVSGSHMQFSANQNLIATAGGSADIGVLRRFTVAAGDAISMFSQRMGMKLFAKGKVEIQSQNDEMALSALKDVTISSVNGRLVLTAAKEVWIGAGGSYIKINANRIENGTPGDILEKCAAWSKAGAASAEISSTLPTSLPGQLLTINLAASPASKAFIPVGMPYRLFADGRGVGEGVVSENGQISINHMATTKEYRLELANGVAYSVPIAEEYRGDIQNGQLANQGFHFHEGLGQSEEDAIDRAVHRKRYHELLNANDPGEVNA